MSTSTIRNANSNSSNSSLNGCVEAKEPDSDFNPTAEQLVDALDDEGTIAAEESAQSNAESQHELNQLQQEGELPLDMLLAQYGYVQLEPLTNSSTAASSSKASLTALISSESSSKSDSPPHQYRSRSGRVVNASGDLKRALKVSGQDLQTSETGLVSHSNSASSNGNSVISVSQVPETSLCDASTVPNPTVKKRVASSVDEPTTSAKRTRVLDLEAPSTTTAYNPRNEADEQLESIVDLDADDDDDEDEPYAVEDLEAEEEEEEEETESEETSDTGLSPFKEATMTAARGPHYGLSAIHNPGALEASDSEDSFEKSPLKLESDDDEEEDNGAIASGFAALGAEAEEEDDDDSVELLVEDADYIPGATSEQAIVEPIPVFIWRKYIRVGDEYQAEVPDHVSSTIASATASLDEGGDEIRWRPPNHSLETPSSGSASDVNGKSWEEEVEAYERKACSLAGIDYPIEIAQPAPDDEDSGDDGAPRPPLRLNSQVVHDNEYALSLLLRNDYHASEALERIQKNIVEESHRMMPVDPVLDWSEVDCRAFEQGLLRFGKNFSSIRATMLPEKTVQQLIHFYYYWKRTERYRKFLELYATYFDEPIPPVQLQPPTFLGLRPSNGDEETAAAGEASGERTREEFDGTNRFSLTGVDMLQLPFPNLLSHEAPLFTPSVVSPIDIPYSESYRQIGYHQQPAFEPPILEMFGPETTGEQLASSSNAQHHTMPLSSGDFIGLPEPAVAEEYTDNATALVDLESPGPDSSAAGFEIHTDEGIPSDSFNGHFDQRST